MRVIVVDDNKRYVDILSSHIRNPNTGESRITSAGEISNLNYERDTPYDIAYKISHNTSKDEDVLLFINLNLCCKGALRQDQAGVHILKYLRLTETFYVENSPGKFDTEPNRARGVHCLIYSFLSPEQILRLKLNNLILFSKGVTFLRSPHDFRSLDFGTLVQRKARLDVLHQYLRGEMSLPDERHDWANWWGIKQLRDVHTEVLGRPTRRYSPKIYYELRRLQSLQAVYLFGHANKQINAAYQNLKADIDKEKTGLADRPPRILHIDDKWQDGWSKIIMDMVYADQLNHCSGSSAVEAPFETYCLNDQPIFRAFKEFYSNKNEVETIYRKVKSFIESSPDNMPDVILLDLRLFGERGGQLKVEELSGTRILNKLRDDFVSIPVIVTTASNKARSHEKLLQLGADGYWIKEGVDENNSPEMTVRNYYRFLELLNKATGKEYQFLRKFNQEVQNLKSISNLWWEDQTWVLPDGTTDITPGRRDVIFKYLEDCGLMLRTYLHNFVMGYGFQYRSKGGLDYWAAAILRHAANTLEEVHRFDLFKLMYDQPCSNAIIGGRAKRSGFEICRADLFAYFLYRKRNDATHSLDRGVKIDWQQLRDYMKYLICYLKFGPQPGFQDTSVLTAANTKDDDPVLTDNTLTHMLTLSKKYDSLFRELTV